VGAGIALFWAVDHGQFEDMDTPALLPMLDGDRARTDAAESSASAASAEATESQP
jgi:nitrogen fixation-related uncharacterized protein